MVSLGTDPSVERIASLQPDLIIASAYKGEVNEGNTPLARLREIAPVVVLETFNTVEEATAVTAELLGDAATVTADTLRE